MFTRRRFLISGAVLAASNLVMPAFARDRFQPVVARLKRFVGEGELPFASVRIARHGRVLAEANFPGIEPVGPHSLYRIYSMTKPVVAVGVVLLVEDGRLKLEDKVAEYVPEFAALRAIAGSLEQLEPARPMTVAHLLTHACGLANSWAAAAVAPLYREAGLVAAAWMYDKDLGGLSGFAQRLSTLPLEFQPGTNWIYGYGLDIAGLVIERVSGQRLGDFLKERIFDPLGMVSTGFFVPKERAAHLAGLYEPNAGGIAKVSDGRERRALARPFADSGSSGLVSTLEDYGRFADMLANGGARGKARVMSAASARLLMSPYGPQEPLRPALERFGKYQPNSVAQALGGIVRLDDRGGPGSAGEYAWGGAAGTGFFANPALGLSFVVMTQLMVTTTSAARDALRPLVYAALAAGK